MERNSTSDLRLKSIRNSAHHSKATTCTDRQNLSAMRPAKGVVIAQNQATHGLK